ncbi:hypothetical protein EDD86DRAFT_240853 [Gorgonomyces haynaldii]|nr:hypothetical protein EDD86DRAFT_240853 [Gorgonomyces haynaldii]
MTGNFFLMFPLSGPAVIKQIISGDSVVLRLKPVNGPPAEMQLILGLIQSPKRDEPFWFEAREFLRQFVGRQVHYKIDSLLNAQKAFGDFVIQPFEGETQICRILVSRGFARVRMDPKRALTDEHFVLQQLEQSAQAQQLGLFSDAIPVHEFSQQIEDIRRFFEQHKRSPLPAIVEQVKDAGSWRVLLVQEKQYINFQLSGIKCPIYRKDIPNVEDLVEPFSEQAKFFVESRLLQKNVHVILESTTQNGFCGSVQFPAGNICEALLSEGFAKIVDWQLDIVTDKKNYLACQQKAQDKKLRLWKEYIGSGSQKSIFEAEIVKILGPDTLLIAAQKKDKVVQLASIRGPKRQKNDQGLDVGYYLDAIEFLRSRLVGERVQVKLDYIKPAEGEFEARECVTITKGTQNIGEALVGKGLANVIKHKRDDNNRSSVYDRLLQAEEKAKEQGKGIHSTEVPVHRIIDYSESAAKAKTHLSYLQRAGTLTGIVEFVASGSRLRVFVPSQNCRLTLVLGNVRVPRAPRNNDPKDKGEPFGLEASTYVSKLVLQRQIEFTVESQDRVGGFIGACAIRKSDLGLLLVEAGFAHVNDNSRNNQYKEAEKRAKDQKKNIWKDFEEALEEIVPERKLRECVVSDLSKSGLFVQFVDGDNGKKLEKMMYDFGQFHAQAGQKVMAPFAPKQGEFCSAQFTADKQWYRARVINVAGANAYQISYIDYGNSETVPGSRLRQLPPQFNTMQYPPFATSVQLQYIQLPEDDYEQDAFEYLQDLVENKTLVADLFGRQTYEAMLYVKEQTQGRIISVNEKLVANGLAYLTKDAVKKIKQDHIRQLKQGYQQKSTDLDHLYEVQQKAMKAHEKIWEYGDFTEDLQQ